MARRVPKEEEARLRKLPLCRVLDALGLYWKKDPTYVPRGDKSGIRINLNTGIVDHNRDREVIITGEKFFDTHDRKFSGGGAIDLVEKLKHCDYLQAVAVLRPIYDAMLAQQVMMYPDTRYMSASYGAERPKRVSNGTWKKASMIVVEQENHAVASVPIQRSTTERTDAMETSQVQTATSRPPLPQCEPSSETETVLRKRSEMIAMYRRVLASTSMNSRDREKIEQRLKELETGR